jgi:hypothetical protein
MTKEEVIKMARAAGCDEASHPMNPWRVTQESLERFANLVRNYVFNEHVDLWLNQIDKAVKAERDEVKRLKALCDEMHSALYVHRASEYLRDAAADTAAYHRGYTDATNFNTQKYLAHLPLKENT